MNLIERDINGAYAEHQETFSKHRGIHKNAGEYDAINIVLDLFRGLRGIIAAVLTAPGWLIDPKRTKAFVNSYFERPQTESLQIFGQFKQATESSHLNQIIEDLKPKKSS